MSGVSLLDELEALGIAIWRKGEHDLSVRAPAGRLDDRLRKAIREQKAELVAALAAREIRRVERRDQPLPASFAQSRLWFLDQLEPGSTSYSHVRTFRFEGPIDAGALERAVRELVTRHESLRTTFVAIEGEPHQVIGSADVALRRVDAASEAEARSVVAKETRTPFDLASGPVLRATLIRIDEHLHLFVLNIHHVATDGWSTGIITRELSALYEAFQQGKPSPLEPLALGYADYAVWQRAQLTGEALERQLQFWRNHLSGAPEVLDLPTDKPRPPVKQHEGGTLPIELSTELTKDVRALCAREGVTPFMLLLTAYSSMLARWTGQSDVVVGTPIANRRRQELEGIVGFFVNTLALRTSFDGAPSFREVLRRVRSAALEAHVHQDLPFEKLVSALGVARDMSRTPVFQTMFAMQNLEGASLQLGSSDVALEAFEDEPAKFDISLTMYEDEENIFGSLEYDVALFERETALRFAGHFVSLLSAAVAAPETPVHVLPLMSDAERRRVLVEWNQTERELEPFAVHERIERTARATPAAAALVTDSESLTYAELNARANRLARLLRRRGLRRGDHVVTWFTRTANMVVAELAAMKAGLAHVPVDPAYPAERIAYVVEDVGARVVVSTREIAAACPDRLRERLLLLDDAELQAELSKESDADLGVPCLGADAAYVIYTSGTTGRPKGSVVLHGNLANLVAQHLHVSALTPADRVTQIAGPAFDAKTSEIWPTLCIGACLYIVSDELRASPDELLAWFVRHAITVVDMPTTLAESSLDADWTGTRVRFFSFGGEALRRRPRPGAPFTFVNVYGPTETTNYVTCEVVEPGEHPVTTIGRPIQNTAIYILDGSGEPAPIGVYGELHVGGRNVGRGYFARPELTAERFVPDPFWRSSGARMYRTGDRARWTVDGRIEFGGRVDDQVKIRGFRIEPGEIENALRADSDVRDAVVVARNDGGRDKRLVGYVVAAEGHVLEAATLRRRLEARLPDYMVPSAFVVLPTIPLTPNGKVDRKALPAPDLAAGSDEYVAPRSAVEETLAEVFREVLRVERVGVHDDFFALGGDSILIIRLVSLARRAGLSFAVKDAYGAPTVARLAEVASRSGAVTVSAEQGQVSGALELLPAQRWFFAREPAEPHHFNQSQLVTLPRPVPKERLERALEAIVRQHDALRLRFTKSDGWKARFAQAEGSFPLEVHDISTLDATARSRTIEERCTKAQTTLDLEKGPLARAVYFACGDDPPRLFLVLHHLVVDGVSWRILLEDVRTLTEGPEGAALPEKTTSLKAFSERLTAYARSEAVREDLDFWRAQPWSEIAPVTPRSAASDYRYTEVRLDAATTSALLTRTLAPYRLHIDEALLTALALALRAWSGGAVQAIQLEGHGRDLPVEDVDASRTLGWFTTMFPVLVRLDANAELRSTIVSVKEQVRAFRKRGPTFGIARWLGGDDALAHVPEPAVVFNYLGQQLSGGYASADESTGPGVSPKWRSPEAIAINVAVADGELVGALAFDPAVIEASAAERLASDFVSWLRALVAHCDEPSAGALTPADVTSVALDQTTLDRITTRAAGAASLARGVYTLSPLQEGLLFHYLSEDEDPYVPQSTFSVPLSTNLEALGRAFQALVDRHEILRTSFVWEGVSRPVQVVHAAAKAPFETLDWTDLGDEELEARLEKWMAEDKRRGFDLGACPLTRTTVIRTRSTYRVVWTTHHVVADGWSGPILVSELFAYYKHFVSGAPLTLDPAPRYGAFLEWLGSRAPGDAETFFRRALAGVTEPTLAAGPEGIAPASWRKVSAALPEELSAALTELSRRLRVTLPTVMHAAWAIVLGRYTGKSDVVFGSTTSGRSAPVPGIEHMVGLFINAVPMRVRLPAEPVADWLVSLQKSFNEYRLHEYAQLAEVQRWSDVPAGQSLFDTLLTVENYLVDESAVQSADDAGISDVRGAERTHYPVSLMVAPGKRVVLALVYDAARFDVPHALEHVETVLRHLVEATTGTSVATLPLMTDVERQRLLVDWNATSRAYAREARIETLLAAQAAEAVAVVDGPRSITFGELQTRADALAALLVARGVGPESVVAVHLPRSIEFVVAILGVLKAGGAYLPIDADAPEERVRYMVEDSRARAILTRDGRAKPDWYQALAIDVSAAPAHGPVPVRGRSENLAYVIYTSGSTGRPKGTGIAHRNVVALAATSSELRGIARGTRCSQFSNVAFDAHAFEIWPALLSGATVFLVPEEVRADADGFASWLVESRIEVAFAPTVFADALLRRSWPSCAMRLITFAGEALGAMPDVLPPFRVVNAYGPTECTVEATEGVVPAGHPRPDIGLPIGNARAHVMAANLELVPIGVPGELCVSGELVGRGYLGRPELTADRFVPDPFARGARMYRTGDLVRRLASGRLEYLGRIDHQVKIRGYRIELGEIETVLAGATGVDQVVVLARTDAGAPKRLVAYVVPKPGVEIRIDALKAELAQRLPEYMVPSAFVVLEALPLTANGKVDRKALPAPDLSSGSEAYVAPRNELEATLVDAFREVLGVERVGVHDDFFALGGDSILIIRVVSAARRAGLALTVKDAYGSPTVARLADVAARSVRAVSVSAEQGQVSGELPLTPIQRWFLDGEPAEPHHFNQSELLSLTTPVPSDRLERALATLVRQHDALRLRFTRGETGWKARFGSPEGAFPLEVVDLSSLDGASRSRAIEERCTKAQTTLNLETGPLARAIHFACGEEPARLFLVLHHLVVDGVSWRILLDDLRTLTEGPEGASLPEKTTSFKAFAERLSAHARSTSVLEDVAFLLAQPWNAVSTVRPRSALSEYRHTEVRLDAGTTSALLTRALKPYRLHIDEALLAALALALGAWSQSAVQAIHLEGHGRDLPLDDVDLSRTLGWFTTMFPVLVRTDAGADLRSTLVSVKEQVRAFRRRGPSFGIARWLGDDAIAQELAALPGPAVVFNYLGQQLTGGYTSGGESTGADVSPRWRSSAAIAINVVVADGELVGALAFDPQVVEASAAERVASELVRWLRAIVAHCDEASAGALTPSDVTSCALDQATLDRIATSATGAPSRAQAVYTLSPLQEGLLFHHVSEEDDPYVPQHIYALPLETNADALGRALQALVDRHEVLRTSFVWEGVPSSVQVVHKEARVSFEVVDLSSLSEEEAEAEVTRRAAADVDRGFDLGACPLTRAILIRTPSLYRLVWTTHHIVSDGWSGGILISELLSLYEHFHTGAPLTLEPPTRWGAFLEWLGSRPRSETDAYFRKMLAGLTEPTLVAKAEGLAPVLWKQNSVLLSEELSTTLVELARRLKITVSTIMHGAWAIALGRYTGKSDVVFGSTTSGRSAPLPGIERMVGLFINAVPVRVQIPEAPVAEWLVDLHRSFNELRSHEFAQLAEVQRLSEVPAGQKLFDTLLTFENYPVDKDAQQKGEGIGVSDVLSIERTHYPVSLVVAPGPRILIVLTYDSARFDIPHGVEHVETVLRHMADAITRSTTTTVRSVPLVGDAEREKLVVEWNDTAQTVLSPPCAHQLFEAQVARTPGAIAVRMGDVSLTYEALDRRANRVARYLASQGARAGTRVGVCASRSIEMIAAVLGILKAGAAYVPLDPAYPLERLAYMSTDAKPAVILTEEPLLGRLPATLTTPLLCLDRDAGRIAAQSEEALDVRHDESATCYVIYTSGSTGLPKGVVLSHRALVNLIRWQQGSAVLAGGTTLQLTPLSFDVSFQEMFSTWHGGGCLVLVDEETRRDPHRLLETLEKQQVERLFLPFIALKNLSLAAVRAERLPRSLRCVVTAGEQLQITPEISSFFEALGGCTLHNHYGPSETHVATAFDLEGPPSAWERLPPIGTPIGNATAYVLDDRFEPVPIGVFGELFLGGICVGDGYLERPQLSAERFVPDPFTTRGGGRLYKTGDLARWRPDGTIEYVGRADGQVKVRGYRIEPGEVEAAIRQWEQVREAVVVARQDAFGDKLLVGYVVPKTEAGVDVVALKAALTKTLPEYMVPSKFVVLEALPLTPSGKVDRKALPAPDVGADHDDGGPPEGMLEEVVADCFVQLLGRPKVGRKSDFFALGGHSILAMRVVNMLQGVGRRQIRVRDVFDAPTVEALARRLGTAEEGDVMPPLTRSEATSGSVLAFVHDVMIGFEAHRSPSRVWAVAQPLDLVGPLDVPRLFRSIRAMLERQTSLRQTFDKRVPGFAPRLCDAEDVPIGQVSLATDEELYDFLGAEEDTCFQVEGEPLVRFTLVRQSERRHCLVVTWHQSVNDPNAGPLLALELEEHYVALGEGRTPKLPPLPLRYTDYAHWERAWFVEAEGRRDVERVRARLVGARPVTIADKPSDVPVGPAAFEVPFSIDPEATARLTTHCRAVGVTPFIGLSAVLGVFLAQWSKQDEVVFVSPVNLRNLLPPEMVHVMGRCLNLVPIRLSLAGDPTWAELFARAKKAVIEAFADERTPAALVFDTPDVYAHPLARVIFNMPSTAGTAAPEVADAPAAELDFQVGPALSHSGARGDLAIVMGMDDSVGGYLRGAVDRFEPGTLEAEAERLCDLLRAVDGNSRPLRGKL